jgi:hypothetical protein
MPARPSKPPPLPVEILERVIRVSSIDGKLVLWLSGFFAIFSASAHYVVGAVAGLAAAGAGALELHGSSLLRRGDGSGLNSAVRGQLILLATILIYSAVRFYTFDPASVQEQITPEVRQRLDETGVTEAQFLELIKTVAQLTSLAVGFVALIYQGGMIRYYVRHRPAVEQALAENEL